MIVKIADHEYVNLSHYSFIELKTEGQVRMKCDSRVFGVGESVDINQNWLNCIAIHFEHALEHQFYYFDFTPFLTDDMHPKLVETYKEMAVQIKSKRQF